jgi:hypothetical protein
MILLAKSWTVLVCDWLPRLCRECAGHWLCSRPHAFLKYLHQRHQQPVSLAAENLVAENCEEISQDNDEE